MYSKIFVNFILIIILATLELAFLRGLPGAISDFNLVLIIIIYTLGIRGVDLALWWAVSMGAFLDVFSFLPFGVYMISLTATIIILNFLLVNFFTNRSLYSFLALTFFGTLIYEFTMHFTSYIINAIMGKETMLILDRFFWLGELNHIFLNLAGALAVFYAFNFISNRLKPVFLIRENSVR